MLRLTSLTIHKFRNVEPCTLEFSDAFNVLLGKNATGKTTLLKLIVAAINGDFGDFNGAEDDDLDVAWEIFKDEDRTARVRYSRVPREVDESEVASIGPDRRWTAAWELELHDGERRGLLKVSHENVYTWDDEKDVAPVRSGDEGDTALSVLLMGGVLLGERAERIAHDFSGVFTQRLSRFDEALEVFVWLVHSAWSEFARPPNEPSGVPQLFFRRGEGDAFAEWTRQIAELLGYDELSLKPKLLEKSPHGSLTTWTYDGFDAWLGRGATEQHHHKLWSFGQKRLFAFFWYLRTFRTLPVVADELLNGLHHEWIQACLDELYERQSFLATQHPMLLDHIPIDSAETARKTFVRCESKTGEDGRTQLHWRNFTADEAERFYRAYETNIQQVSEILRSEGLW